MFEELANLPPEQALTVLRIANSAMQDRINNTVGLGKQYGTDRDVYEALGYPKELTFSSLWARYKRKGYGRRVVELYPEESWKKKPIINDLGDPSERSPFETAFDELAKRLRLWHWLLQVDIQSGINEYGVLYFGDVSVGSLKEPLENGKIKFLRAYNDNIATISSKDENIQSERFDQPEFYQIQFSTGGKPIHHSRVVHVADNTESSPIYGSSRLAPVYNNILALELVLGADGEGFWRNNIQKYAANAQADSKVKETTPTEVAEQLKKLIHNYQQYIVTQGMEVTALAPDVVEPTTHADVQIAEICTALKCPRRIFEGSERGELASSQDGKAWAGRMDTRRQDHNEPIMLRPTIDKFIEIGELPEPEGGGYNVDWPPLIDTEPKEVATIAKLEAETIAAYANAIGAESLLPFDSLMAEVLRWDTAKVRRIVDARGEIKRVDDDGREDDG